MKIATIDDLQTIRLFLRVAEESSFARAARRMGMSPAVATRRIAALEAELSVRLFTRSTRQVSLTQEGWLLRGHAEHLIDVADTAMEAIQAGKVRPSGRLRVLCRAGLARHLVAPFMGEFRALYPEVSVGIEVTEDRMLNLLESGCEVGITIGELADSSLVARRIAHTESQLFASPDYLQARGEPRDPAQLADHDCLTIVADSGVTTWQFSQRESHQRVRIEAPLAINDPDALLCFARAGLGIVMMADWYVNDDVVRGALKRVLADYRVEPRGAPITMLFPSRKHLPLRVRAFTEFLAARCAERFGALPA